MANNLHDRELIESINVYVGRKQEDAFQTLIVNLILKRYLRNLREMSMFSSQSHNIMFIWYRVSKKYGGKRLKMTHRNRK